uniref:NCCRP1, F-box associated domain containing n=1 Tax=Gopherus evgoodei TaxID=1825980 RepID=A0A8C4YF53_9SAUR
IVYYGSTLAPHWCVKQQRVDLLAEGLWEELLDSYQPNITVMDWYWLFFECRGGVYQLHVRLLGDGDYKGVPGVGKTLGRARCLFGPWVQVLMVSLSKVSHVFHGYGPGVRYVHFQHQTLDAETPGGLRRTRATDSSVSVQLRD